MRLILFLDYKICKKKTFYEAAVLINSIRLVIGTVPINCNIAIRSIFLIHRINKIDIAREKLLCAWRSVHSSFLNFGLAKLFKKNRPAADMLEEIISYTR